MKYIALLGRILFALVFLLAITHHFSKGAVSHAESAGVPMASIAVPLSGIIAFVGGLMIVFGYKARWGAWLIVLFLVPVTLVMHTFWKETDPQKAEAQQTNFMKNVSMLGAALLITQVGSGPLSLKD